MRKAIKDIPIKIKNQHQLLNSLSEGYKSLAKSLMEYIDNSFDSAEDFFNRKKGLYKRDVLISIHIDRKNNEIFIQDNCNGMNKEILEGLASSINESEKKRKEQKRAWINGQFGLGAHAFRFFAQELIVTTKQKDSQVLSILIDRDKEIAQQIEPTETFCEPNGTLVEISSIDKYHIKHLKLEELKKDIETYFEMLLKRNVKIKISDQDNEYICEPFDYSQVPGTEIKKIINKWKEGNSTTTVLEKNGIIVNLKICTEKIDRPPFFSRKGRRINFISHLDSFIRKTEHRKKVWENFYLTGYIEVQENLEPVVTRDDFLGGRGKQQKRTGIYEEIVKLEDEIYLAIESANKNKIDENLKNFASTLTDLLSKIAQEEEIKLKYQSKGDEIKNREKVRINLNENSLDEFKIKNKNGGGIGLGSDVGNTITKGEENLRGETEGQKLEKQKRGIKIEFNSVPSEKRSHYGDGVITIFTSNPDFETRRGITQQAELGSMKITARLANYLAAVISSEFKEIFYQQKKLEPDRKMILEEQIDFIFRFEEMMKQFIDQPLNSIGKLKR
jgi:hypothetical protein